jgi:hypothetical protein
MLINVILFRDMFDSMGMTWTPYFLSSILTKIGAVPLLEYYNFHQ